MPIIRRHGYLTLAAGLLGRSGGIFLLACSLYGASANGKQESGSMPEAIVFAVTAGQEALCPLAEPAGNGFANGRRAMPAIFTRRPSTVNDGGARRIKLQLNLRV